MRAMKHYCNQTIAADNIDTPAFFFKATRVSLFEIKPLLPGEKLTIFKEIILNVMCTI